VLTSRDQQAQCLAGAISAGCGGMVVDQSGAGGVDSIKAVRLAAAPTAAPHRWHGLDHLLAGRLQHSGQAVAVCAGAFDGPEHALPGGRMLTGPAKDQGKPRAPAPGRTRATDQGRRRARARNAQGSL
jgi:hypothetical protein